MLNKNGSVLIVSGEMNLCMKMEEYYQKQDYQKNYESHIQDYQSQKEHHRTQQEPGFKTAFLIWKEIKKLEKEGEI